MRPAEPAARARGKLLPVRARRAQQQGEGREKRGRHEDERAFALRPSREAGCAVSRGGRLWLCHGPRARLFFSQQAQRGARFRFFRGETRVLLADSGDFVLELFRIEQKARAVPQPAQVAALEQPALENLGIPDLNHGVGAALRRHAL